MFTTARNPVLSIFQSAAAALARANPAAAPLGQAAAHLVAARTDPTRAYAGPAPSMTCAGLGLDLLQAVLAGDLAQQNALHDRIKFSKCDPAWAATLVDYATALGRPVPYIRHTAMTDFVIPAQAARLRVALLSDWGTGTSTAQRVAAQMAAQQPDVVIHLGDIYYAGTADECTAHFLQPLRAVLPHTPLFTLCGNHDVYSGGEGYYGLLRQIGQPASYFCLRSPDQSWQILAADTGLHDRDPFDEAAALTELEPDELAWHADKLRGFPGRTIVLTHHQPFSAFAQIGKLADHNPVNPNLMEAFARLSAAGRIDAWFWGHEHRLSLYAPYRGLPCGRNIGYGAVPVEAVPGGAAPLPGLNDPPVLQTPITLDVVEGAYAHGFALLDLSPEATRATYWSLTRPTPIHTETIKP